MADELLDRNCKVREKNRLIQERIAREAAAHRPATPVQVEREAPIVLPRKAIPAPSKALVLPPPPPPIRREAATATPATPSNGKTPGKTQAAVKRVAVKVALPAVGEAVAHIAPIVGPGRVLVEPPAPHRAVVDSLRDIEARVGLDVRAEGVRERLIPEAHPLPVQFKHKGKDLPALLGDYDARRKVVCRAILDGRADIAVLLRPDGRLVQFTPTESTCQVGMTGIVRPTSEAHARPGNATKAQAERYSVTVTVPNVNRPLVSLYVSEIHARAAALRAVSEGGAMLATIAVAEGCKGKLKLCLDDPRFKPAGEGFSVNRNAVAEADPGTVALPMDPKPKPVIWQNRYPSAPKGVWGKASDDGQAARCFDKRG